MALALDESKESDHTVDNDGTTFIIDKKLSEKVGSVKIDFIEQGFRPRFSIVPEKPIDFGIPGCGSGCSC